MKRLAAAIGAIVGLGMQASGCSLPLEATTPDIGNSCSSDADCGIDGRCIEQTCVATNADLAGLLITIDVPEGSPEASGTTSVVFPGDDISLSGNREGGFYHGGHDLHTNALADVLVRMEVESPSPDCSAMLVDGAFPIEIQLVQKIINDSGEPIDGVPLPTYQATSSPVDTQTNEVISRVPVGRYDVYVIPMVDPAYPGCRLPPTFLPDQNLPEGQVSIAVAAGTPALLEIHVLNYLALGGWTLDLVENTDGRVISNKVALDAPGVCTDGPGPCYFLEHWTEVLEQSGIDPVVRLTPPEGSTSLPTILAKLEALDIFGTGQNTIDLGPLQDADVVTLTGNLVSDESAEPIPGTLVIQSTQLIGGALGDIATYRAAIETEPDGSFRADLLWGNYDVIAVPNGEEWGVTLNQIELKSGMDEGKTVFAKRKRTLSGSAMTPQSEPAHDVQVSLSPAGGSSTSFLVSKLVPTMQGSPAAAITDAQGLFSLSVDPGGTFNLSLQPPAASDLPWALLSNLAIDDLEQANVTVQLSNPVVMNGLVRASDNVVPNAIIRAYIQPEYTGPVIQIGEATADVKGHYELLLPATIAAAVTQ